VFAGHIKVIGGPHVARGPDVAQACSWGKGDSPRQQEQVSCGGSLGSKKGRNVSIAYYLNCSLMAKWFVGVPLSIFNLLASFVKFVKDLA
jgi:hypothetical protein